MKKFALQWICFLSLCASPIYAFDAVEVPGILEVFFSPKDGLANRLIALCDEEKSDLKIAIYTLSHQGIAKAISRAYKRGVDVEVIIDPACQSSWAVKHLIESGIPVYVWNRSEKNQRKTTGEKYALMHHKFCIFNSEMVWTGSFNFTYSAHSNHQENAVLIRSPETVKKFVAHFEEMRTSGASLLSK